MDILWRTRGIDMVVATFANRSQWNASIYSRGVRADFAMGARREVGAGHAHNEPVDLSDQTPGEPVLPAPGPVGGSTAPPARSSTPRPTRVDALRGTRRPGRVPARFAYGKQIMAGARDRAGAASRRPAGGMIPTHVVCSPNSYWPHMAGSSCESHAFKSNVRCRLNKDLVESPVDINLTDPELYSHGDPYAVWKWLRENDPVHWHPPTALPGFWALTKYEDVHAVYRDPDNFSSAGGILLRPENYGDDPGGGRTMALTDPPRHRQLRALVDDWFAPRSIRLLEDEMRLVAREVVLMALERETCDFVTEIAARIPLYVICKMMGVPRKTGKEYSR
jgi:hypothetical protein